MNNRKDGNQMYKQIIIARKDLNMSPGKLAAQVAHGSMAFLTTILRSNAQNKERQLVPLYTNTGRKVFFKHPDIYAEEKKARAEGKKYLILPTSETGYTIHSFDIEKDLYEQWINAAYTKAVLRAKNKNHLLKAKTMAEELGMVEGEDFFCIYDNCRTELEPEEENGRTLTVIGFKPMDAETIDQIGKKYHLYI